MLPPQCSFTTSHNMMEGLYISLAKAVCSDLLKLAQCFYWFNVWSSSSLSNFSTEFTWIFSSNKWLLGWSFHLPQHHRFLQIIIMSLHQMFVLFFFMCSCRLPDVHSILQCQRSAFLNLYLWRQVRVRVACDAS